MIDRRLLAVAVIAGAAAAALTAYVVGHPINPADVTVERDVQSVPWGPMVIVFGFFSFIGDAKGAIVEALVFVAVLIFNRRAWPFAALASLEAGWYLLLSHLIFRPRPTTAQVLQVTEHPGASSFPSGHTMFIVTVVTVLMLCLGYRFLRGRILIAGWLAGGVLVLINGLGRIDSGAHWPSDVVAALLIALTWLTAVLSLRPIHERVFPR
ncbi:MAG TPA: phosphatase PAP2 family protein [Candidatus Dormibacteraeota bacterium]|nr:phosphatase PAP2 family protein [Candidatus Dormibacteraeota bacterium]